MQSMLFWFQKVHTPLLILSSQIFVRLIKRQWFRRMDTVPYSPFVHKIHVASTRQLGYWIFAKSHHLLSSNGTCNCHLPSEGCITQCKLQNYTVHYIGRPRGKTLSERHALNHSARRRLRIGGCPTFIGENVQLTDTRLFMRRQL